MDEKFELNKDKLPEGFEYPEPFGRVVRLGLVDLEPWYILSAAQANDRMDGLKARYPTRALVPFARRGDNDDVACFEIGRNESAGRNASVVVIHDFASAGSENRRVYATFWDWFRDAVEEMIEWED